MSDRTPNVVAVMLAGGQGSRLHELTDTFCKPAVPFAGGRRIVDWTMDNLLRLAPSRLIVATQYRPEALVAHLNARWRSGFAPGTMLLRNGPDVSETGYLDTADAVTCNLDEISAADPDVVLVVAADHVYRMDYAAMIEAHRASGRPVSVAVDRVPLDQARAFGVLAADASGRVTGFDEKPRDPKPMAGDPTQALVSMGIYAFDWAWLRETLELDRADETSSHDFGHDILPAAVRRNEAQVFDAAAAADGAFFWRDVGTLDSLRETCLEIATGAVPCACPPYPGTLPLGQGTQILPGGTVVLPGGQVSRGARLRRVVVAPGAVIPADLTAGFDPEQDARQFRTTPSGTVLITSRMLAHRTADDMRRLLRPASVAAESLGARLS